MKRCGIGGKSVAGCLQRGVSIDCGKFAGSLLLPSGKFSRFALAVAVTLTAVLGFVSVGIRSPATSRLSSDLSQTAIVLWAAYCCFHVARCSSGYLRHLWTLLAGAFSLATAAQVLETYCQNALHLPAETPWPSDVLLDRKSTRLNSSHTVISYAVFC